MSTTRALKKAFTGSKEPVSKKTIELVLPAELRQKLSKSTFDLGPSWNDEYSFYDLQLSYAAIEDAQADPASQGILKLALEEYKLKIMTAILNYLKSKDGQSSKPEETTPAESGSWLYRFLVKTLSKFQEDKEKSIEHASMLIKILKMAGFVVFGGLSLLVSIMESFNGIHAIMPLIFGSATSPIVLAATLFLVAASGVLFCAFEGAMLKEMFGVSLGKSDFLHYLAFKEEQCKTLEQINHLMKYGDVKEELLTDGSRESILQMVLSFNQDVQDNKNKIKNYKEHPLKKVMRYGIFAIGAVLTASFAYFSAVACLTALTTVIGVTLVGTPVGWAIIGLMIAIGLIGYFAMQGSTLTSFFNPAKKQFDKLKKKLSSFEVKDENDFKSQSKLHIEKNEENKPTESQTRKLKQTRMTDFFSQASSSLSQTSFSETSAPTSSAPTYDVTQPAQEKFAGLAAK